MKTEQFYGPLKLPGPSRNGPRTFRAFLAPLQRKLEFRPRGIFDAAVGQVRIIWFVELTDLFLYGQACLGPQLTLFWMGGGRGRGEGRGRGVEPVMALTL